METSKVGIMSVVNLSFVADNSKQVIFVHRIWAGIPLVLVDQLLHTVLAIQDIAHGKGSDAAAFTLPFITPFPPPPTTNVV